MQCYSAEPCKGIAGRFGTFTRSVLHRRRRASVRSCGHLRSCRTGPRGKKRLLQARQEGEGCFAGHRREVSIKIVEHGQWKRAEETRVPPTVPPHNSHGRTRVLALLLKGAAAAPQRIADEHFGKIIELAHAPELEPQIPVLKSGQ